MVAICLLQKYSANKIVRAGPAQPAQLDGMHQISFLKTNEMSDICSVRGSKQQLMDNRAQDTRFWEVRR